MPEYDGYGNPIEATGNWWEQLPGAQDSSAWDSPFGDSYGSNIPLIPRSNDWDSWLPPNIPLIPRSNDWDSWLPPEVSGYDTPDTRPNWDSWLGTSGPDPTTSGGLYDSPQDVSWDTGNPIANFFKQLLKGTGSGAPGSLASGLGAIGKGLGAVARTSAANRGTQLAAMMDADKMRILLDKERQAAESDMARKLAATNYVKGWTAPSRSKPVMSASGKPFTQYGFGPRDINAEDKQVAATLEQQLLKRLNNPMTLSDYNSKMEPGAKEDILNWLAPLLATQGNQPIAPITAK